MTQLNSSLWALCTCVFLLAGCPGELKDPTLFDNLEVRCDLGGVANVEALLFLRCGAEGGGCHAASVRAGSLDLESPNVADRLTGVGVATTDPRCIGREQIVAGDSGASYLAQKLGSNVGAYCGSRMPVSTITMSPLEIACIEEWIDGLDGSTPMDAGTDASSDAATDAAADAGDGGAP